MMKKQISLKEADRKVFRTAYNDGLWDILMGCFFSIFAIAPFLSTKLGDFWSSAIFLPFWALVFLILWSIKKKVVIPRIGIVEFGHARKAKLMKFSIVMLIINIIAFIAGIIAAVSFKSLPGQSPAIIFGLLILSGSSVTAYILDFNRLYIYGLLLGLSPIAGEWLYKNMNAVHHGFPITFGATSGIMILVGLIIFVRLLRNNPVINENIQPKGV